MSVNKVILLGRVGKDPLVTHVQGIKKVTFSLATYDRGYTKSDGTKVPERTEWHNLVAWNKAELCEKYVRSGNLLYVEGKLKSRSWVGQDGVKHYITEIIVEELELFPKYQAQTPAPAPAPQQQGNLWDDPNTPI